MREKFIKTLTFQNIDDYVILFDTKIHISCLLKNLGIFSEK